MPAPRLAERLVQLTELLVTPDKRRLKRRCRTTTTETVPSPWRSPRSGDRLGTSARELPIIEDGLVQASGRLLRLQPELAL
jgi:hypothetical protein